MGAVRTPLIAGNWKMNLDHLQAIALVQKLSWALGDVKHDFADVEVAVFPPFTDLRSVQTLIAADKLALKLGAQDVSAHTSGAFTGEISSDFLSLSFIAPFVSHCGVIIGVLYLTFALKMKPQPGSVWRVFALSQVYVLIAGFTNYLLHENYGYLCEKPESASLLDYFGPWPIYLISCEVIALILGVILYSPFWFINKKQLL